MHNCAECGFQFHLLSQRFYCCDASEPVCSVCHRKVCQRCQKPRKQQIKIPRCDRCCSRLFENDLLFQYNCQRYYCSKCLSQIFKSAYDQVTLGKVYDKDTEVFVAFPCGHQYPFEEMIGFFQHFCICCGAEYNSGLDWEFNDGVKLCYACHRYFGKTYEQVMIKCQMCQGLIKNSSKALIPEGSDVAICTKCSMVSQDQQKNIAKSRSKKNIAQSQNIKQPQSTQQSKKQHEPQVIYKNQKFPQVKINNNQPQFFKLDTFQDKNQQKSPSNKSNLSSNKNQQTKQQKNPLTKLLKKPSISQLKKKQEKRSSMNKQKQNSVSVTSRFSNNFQDIEEQVTKSLGLGSNVKLKRHLSNQTYVEQYKIEVPENVETDFVHCKRCNVKAKQNLAFNLYDQGETMNSSRSIVDFSSLKVISSLNNEKNSYFICRVCYSKSAERQKSLLSLNGVKSKVQERTRPSKIQEPVANSMDYLKVENSMRRPNRSPSPSPNDKQYSLTGSKIDLGFKKSINFKKQDLLSSIQDKRPEQQQQYYKEHPKPTMQHHISGESRTTGSKMGFRFMKCDCCRDVKKSLIATLNQGYLCEDCYYLKNPSSVIFSKS